MANIGQINLSSKAMMYKGCSGVLNFYGLLLSSIKINIYFPVNANIICLYRIILAAYFSRSLLSRGGVYLNNDDCIAASKLSLINSKCHIIGQG